MNLDLSCVDGSADWDEALRKAIIRAPSRRFTTYWSVRGEASDEAQRLIEHRQVQVVPIRDADAFFETIRQTVQSIDEYSKPHPLSTEAAVGSLKRYLSGPEHRIQLSDLIASVVEQVVMATSGEGFEVQGGESPTIQSVTARIRKYDAACQTLLAMASTAGFWAEDDNLLGWERATERFYASTGEPGFAVWLTLRMYPGILTTYAFGLGAVEADRVVALNSILGKNIRSDNNIDGPTTVLSQLIEGLKLFYQYKLLEGMDNHPVAISDWIHSVLRQPLKHLIADDLKFSFVFDKFEILVSLGFYHRNGGSWMPLGSFVHRRSNRERIIGEIQESIRVLGDDSPFVVSGIFGENGDECLNVLIAFKEYMAKVALSIGFYG